MEFINGRTLHEMLAESQRPFSESLVIQWAYQLCDVLGYLHNQNPKIIFRDLKPDNIMITVDNQVKLIDFGIVRFFTPGKKKDTIALGTKGYAAPEQFGSGQTDERSDIYSLGATLFHLLTAEDPESHVMKIPPVRQYNAAVSLPMNELVFRATRPTIQDRFPSMQQMGNSLPSQAQTSVPTSTTVYSNPQPTSSVRVPARPTARLVQATAKLTAQWSNQQLMMAGVALLAVILAGVWLITPIIQGTWFWHYVPTIAILAPVIFAATRRRGLAGIGQASAAFLAGALTWYRAEVNGDYAALFIGALISAGAIEVVLYFLPKITAGMKRDDPGTWKREAAWLGLTAVVGYILLFWITFNFSVAFRFISLFFAFLLGGIGWFVGDLIYTAWETKRSYP
jgi:serine/threonine protein kinase